MIEKVNPMHPDKIADRIAGAMVDLAYTKNDCPKIAVEVLIGHGVCQIIAETSEHFTDAEIEKIVNRISDCETQINYLEVPQDKYLAKNQSEKIKCGDNGIFNGIPVSEEEKSLSKIIHDLYKKFPTDGKFILNDGKLIVCQSNAKKSDIEKELENYPEIKSTIINPLGEWTGGINVDSGATNRKLGSDMGRAITGGGLHGKDLSKTDVSVNIYAHIKAQETGKPAKLCCAIGDEKIDGKPYSEIVEFAKCYIDNIGGFEKLAEWGLF